MCLPPAARTSRSPTPSLGAGVPAKHLEWGGLEVGRARVQRVGGSCSAPPVPPSCPPILSSVPRWRQKIFYFLLFIISDLGPVLPIE